LRIKEQETRLTLQEHDDDEEEEEEVDAGEWRIFCLYVVASALLQQKCILQVEM
jgi:hypothetical protein